MRSIIRFSLLILGLCIATTLAAQEAGDPQAGKEKAFLCLGCHGIKGYANVYPAYHVPKVGGQNPEYIISALKAYKAGKRDHATMKAQASTLSEEDMRDIAAFFSTAEPVEEE